MKLIWRIFALGPSVTENRMDTRLRSIGVTVVVTSAAAAFSVAVTSAASEPYRPGQTR